MTRVLKYRPLNISISKLDIRKGKSGMLGVFWESYPLQVLQTVPPCFLLWQQNIVETRCLIHSSRSQPRLSLEQRTREFVGRGICCPRLLWKRMARNRGRMIHTRAWLIYFALIDEWCYTKNNLIIEYFKQCMRACVVITFRTAGINLIQVKSKREHEFSTPPLRL